MPNWGTENTGYDMKSAGAIDPDKKEEMMYRSVTLTAANEVDLADAGEKVQGSIVGFDAGQVIIAEQSRGLRFRNAGATAIAAGKSIVGGTRTVTGQTSAKGYVKAGLTDTIVTAEKNRGTVIDGGGAYAANSQAEPDVEVAMSFG